MAVACLGGGVAVNSNATVFPANSSLPDLRGFVQKFLADVGRSVEKRISVGNSLHLIKITKGVGVKYE